MNLDSALKLAAEEFKKIDWKDIASRSGAIVTPESIRVEYLNRSYCLRLPDAEWEGEVSSREKLLILHYLINSKGTPLSGKLIDFREFPGGNVYYPVFEARACRPFLKYFGKNQPLLLKAALALKGSQQELGDFSVNIPVFPRVGIIFIVYRGDEELAPTAKILFDSSVSEYLDTEDVTAVCEDACRSLIRQRNG
ncbi:MAG: DUF3786 domain-containing protein [Candidatus Omnitrophica bacterium]|nr:DUF3786 domain-containing protein [Candidatus Omnitrophota bacterium]